MNGKRNKVVKYGAIFMAVVFLGSVVVGSIGYFLNPQMFANQNQAAEKENTPSNLTIIGGPDELNQEFAALEKQLETSTDKGLILVQMGQNREKLADVYVEMKKTEEANKNYLEAEKYYIEGIAAKPNLEGIVNYSLVGIYQRTERLDEADALYQKIIAASPTVPEPLVAYGEFFSKFKKDSVKAEECFAKALTMAQTDDEKASIEAMIEKAK